MKPRAAGRNPGLPLDMTVADMVGPAPHSALLHAGYERFRMTFKELSARVLEPLFQWVMVAGIVALCQPWVEVLHRYGATIILVGLIGFLIFTKIRPPAKVEG